MTQQAETTTEEYSLHVRLAKERQAELVEAAQLAAELQAIPKADLVDLIDLFIQWGLGVLKVKWLDRMGYK